MARLLDTGHKSIFWADPEFTAGRLKTYLEVPSNTKVKLFKRYSTASPALANVSQPALKPLEELDPGKGCLLKYAQNMVEQLTQGISKHYADKVRFHKGRVQDLCFRDGSWHLDNDMAVTPKVFLATGCYPSKLPVAGDVQTLELDDMLVPSQLAGKISDSDTVGVIGSSHSAVLVLRNLLEGSVRPKKVLNFYRSPFKYAVDMPGDWILYDNTGLKGLAQEWAKEKLETHVFEESGALERICVKDMPFNDQQQLWQTRCNKLVFAVGYSPSQPPKVKGCHQT